MKLFTCRNCGQLLYFENIVCERCNHALGYQWEEDALLTLTPAQDEQWLVAAAPETLYTYCANHAYNVCNWLIPTNTGESLCLACQLNRTIPSLDQDENHLRWQKLETAKHRLVYSLLQLRLPVVSKQNDAKWGLAFDFLADNVGETVQPITTGHANGIITINIAEADDARREQLRQSLVEPYRTLLGHFRHEIAHYYWMHFARSRGWRRAFRQVFGNEKSDYAQALAQHYAAPPTDEWREEFISAYAAVHPWEDWAETWAHYLHIVDTLETAHAFGMQIDPLVEADETLAADIVFNAYQQTNFDRLIETWLPVAFAMNSLNRAMGQPDLYPFVLTPAVLSKMAFVHDSVRTEQVR